MVDISTVGIMSVSKRSALEASRRELSEDVPFGLGTLLVVEQSILETRPKGAWHTYAIREGSRRSPTGIGRNPAYTDPVVQV